MINMLKKQRAMTLIELIAVILISGIIGVSVVGLLQQPLKSYTHQLRRYTLSNNAEYVYTFLQQQFLMAKNTAVTLYDDKKQVVPQCSQHCLLAYQDQIRLVCDTSTNSLWYSNAEKLALLSEQIKQCQFQLVQRNTQTFLITTMQLQKDQEKLMLLWEIAL